MVTESRAAFESVSMWGGDQLIWILLRFGGAIAIWYVLTYGLSGEQKDPVSHGRKVAAWVAASVVITTPSMHRNGPDLAVFILINGLVWGGVAFVVGYLWRKFKPIPNASTSGNEDMEARVNSGATLNTAGTQSRKALEEVKKLFFILLGIDITITVVVGFNAFSTIGILKEIASGARVANESLISSLTFWENFSKLLLLTLIGVGFGLVKWLNSCYRFAKDSLGATGFVNERWTVFGWIIPFFNLVKPYQVINEIFKAGAKNYTTTDGWKREAGSGLLLTWWIFWAVTHFIGTLFSQQLLKGVTSDHLTVQQVIHLTGMQASLCVVSVIIAGLWFVVVNHLTQRLFDRASKSGTPVKAPPEFNASPNTRPENSSTARLDGTEEVAWTNWRTTPNSMAEILPAPTLRSTAYADIKNTQGVPTAMINDLPIPPDVDTFYDTVGKELEDGKPDRATWTRAFAEADGDDAKARAVYIRLRVARLMAAYEAEMAAKFKAERSASIEADKFAKSEEIINAEKVAKAESERLALMKAEVQEKSNEQRSRRGKAGGLGALIGGSVVAVLILYLQFHKVPLIDLIAEVCGWVPFGAMIGGLLGWLLSGLNQWSAGVAPRDRKRR